MKLQTPVTASMFENICYVATPYSLQHLNTHLLAISTLNKYLGKLYKLRPNWVAVNALYSLEEITLTKYLGCARALMDASSQLHVLTTPGWEYCDIVLSEINYFLTKNKQVIYV